MPSLTNTAAVAGAAITLLANTASAHLIMQKPVPFGVDSLNNSPLEDGMPGDYPCKQRAGVYDITTMNFMKVGDPQELSFEGSASHGGGTCQLAVSLDKEPTPNSTFKIIQVFEGGCPVTSDGNTGTHPFTFTIPEGFPNGVSTFAWYWNNRVGNREAYMNCAPITVSGGSDDLSYFDSLPNLFLANLPSSDCEVPESSSLQVPNPGQFVMKAPGEALIKPSGPKCAAYAAAQTEGVKGYQSATKKNIAAYSAPANGGQASTGKAQANATPAAQLGGGSGSGSGSGAPAAAPTSAPAAPDSGAGGSPPAASYGDGSAPANSAPADAGTAPMITMSTLISSAPVAATSAPAAAAPSYPAAAAPSGGAPPSSGTNSTGGACDTSKAGITCSPDGAQFGMCTAGGEMVWQKVAGGTKCVGGAIAAAEGGGGQGQEKRDAGVHEGHGHFVNPHVRRHVRGAGMHKRAYDF